MTSWPVRTCSDVSPVSPVSRCRVGSLLQRCRVRTPAAVLQSENTLCSAAARLQSGDEAFCPLSEDANWKNLQNMMMDTFQV